MNALRTRGWYGMITMTGLMWYALSSRMVRTKYAMERVWCGTLWLPAMAIIWGSR